MTQHALRQTAVFGRKLQICRQLEHARQQFQRLAQQARITLQALTQLCPLFDHQAACGFVTLLIDQLLRHLLVLGRRSRLVWVLPLGRHAANATGLHAGKGALSQHRRRCMQERRQRNQPQRKPPLRTLRGVTATPNM
ncbi:MAG: hypothetical protein JF607_25750 [Burkholderiales bacterium]|nr:hypothetical protein [Burkholderiales bacterium]